MAAKLSCRQKLYSLTSFRYCVSYHSDSSLININMLLVAFPAMLGGAKEIWAAGALFTLCFVIEEFTEVDTKY